MDSRIVDEFAQCIFERYNEASLNNSPRTFWLAFALNIARLPFTANKQFVSNEWYLPNSVGGERVEWHDVDAHAKIHHDDFV